MEKRDIIVIVVAILIVLIMAMYIKPLVTGKEAKLIPDEISNFFSQKNETVEEVNFSINNSNMSLPSDNQTYNTSVNVSSNESEVNITLTPTVTQIQPWNGSPVVLPPGNLTQQGMVPREYVSSYQRYSFMEPAVQLKTYTTISGKYSQTTSPITIPSKYWEIWYTVELPEDLQNPMLEEQSEDDPKVQSLSAVNPYFEFSVINAETNQVIRRVIPPGGLDPKVWKGTFGRGEDSKTTILSEKGDEIEVNWDPRPWKEKFFEGYNTYRLDIHSRFITSYSLDIKLPDPVSLEKTDVSKNDLNRSTPSSIFRQIMDYFIMLYNGDLTLEPNKTEFCNLFSSEVLKNRGCDGCIREINQMKSSGVNISEYKIDNSFYRLNEGNLKGSFIWERNGSEYVTSHEIPFVIDSGYWKMDILPIIRF